MQYNKKKVSNKDKKIQPLDETTDKMVLTPGMDMNMSAISRIEQVEPEEQLLDLKNIVESKMTADQSCAPLRAKMLVDVQV